MGAKKRGAPAPRPRSGFVTEEQRNTERLTLRLDPETMSQMRALAKERGWTMAECVQRAWDVFQDALEDEETDE